MAKINLTKVHKKRNRVSFLRTRMWLETIMNRFRDPTTGIPNDIGDNIIIHNNSLIAKNGITKLIIVDNLGLEVYQSISSDLINYVKRNVQDVVVDISIKTTKFSYDPYSTTNRNMYKGWKESLKEEESSKTKAQLLATMCLTFEKAQSGADLRSFQLAIAIRSKHVSSLNKGVSCVERFLNQENIVYSQVKSDLASYMSNISPACINSKPIGVMNSLVMETRSIAELLPGNPGFPDNNGVLIGLTTEHYNPYYIDFKNYSDAKNIYVLGPSGSGKTFLVQNCLKDAALQDYRFCITDIKGTEFLPFCEYTNGTSISLSSSNSVFINTLRLDYKHSLEEYPTYIKYFEAMFNLTKTMLILIINPSDLEMQLVDSFVEKLIYSYYNNLGVTKENYNSWVRTEHSNPYDLYDYLVQKFLSASIKDEYEGIIDKILDSLSIYLSRTGSNSSLFKKEADLNKIKESRTVHFNYGVLGNNRVKNKVLASLLDFYVSIISDLYIAHSKKMGKFTILVNEESQLASAHIKHMYAENISLRRAQNAVTIILGNSIAGMSNDADSNIILDNINIWVLGKLTESNIKSITEEYGLGDVKSELKLLSENKNDLYTNTFLIVNKLNRDTMPTFIKSFVPDTVLKDKSLKTVDTVENKNIFKLGRKKVK